MFNLTLTPEVIVRAYASGVFPMARAHDDPRLYWIDPQHRGILPLDGLKVSRSLRKILRQEVFSVTVDKAFSHVIRACATRTPKRAETWINDRITRVFTDLHRLGMAHSVECWSAGSLVGGLYGLSLGGAFFGESMFSRMADASKVALCHLVARLKRGGFHLLDTQFTTPHLCSLGAIEIPRDAYHERLESALAERGEFHVPVPEDGVLDILDRPCGY
ncbi:leucyl/phenylalanyl-tRNA--protein transferase [Pararhodospirillum oryzae]|uniref:Leucyl/phenylalanyl-tRNA--protein transferase n=1 Tax=Pararhodospirillum oryzae TaxID=478448 RepID=A0A512H6K8_9PROT|nr:leucyl/phenylalanyl-tRNA--protein transferase [Pararhodospirillum oryzae]